MAYKFLLPFGHFLLNGIGKIEITFVSYLIASDFTICYLKLLNPCSDDGFTKLMNNRS